jgi:probable HAF family extracellular repeat protein
MHNTLNLILVIISTFLFFNPVHAAFFMGLGDLQNEIIYSGATGVSADGSVVVGYGSSEFGNQAFRWTKSDGMVGLGDLPGGSIFSWAYGVSSDGSVVVGYSTSADGPEAFRWTESDGMVGLGDLPGGNFESYARGTSGDGSVVVGNGSYASPGSEAFFWTNDSGTIDGGMLGLGDLLDDNISSYAYGVSTDGLVVVGLGCSTWGTEAFRWTYSRGMVGLGGFQGAGPWINSHAYAVSADGSVVVGFSYNYDERGPEAFRWTESGGMVGLGDLPEGGFDSEAYAVSDNGAIVVGQGYSAVGWEAFMWDSTNGMQNLKDVLTNKHGLDLTGWFLDSAQGISADGKTFAGYGTNPDGKREAWIANINSLPTGDFDADKEVDGFDLCHFIIAYSNNTYPDADLDNDGSINSNDIGIFVQEYGWYFE